MENAGGCDCEPWSSDLDRLASRTARVLRPQGQSCLHGQAAGSSSLLSTHRPAVLMEAPTPSPQDALGPWEVPMCIPNGGSSCFLRKKMTFVRGREPEKEVCLFPLFLEKDSSNNTTYCKILKEKNAPPPKNC